MRPEISVHFACQMDHGWDSRCTCLQPVIHATKPTTTSFILMPANLPPELRSFVISNVHHKKDLISLALTCHALREEAQRALFSSPVIHIYPKPHRSQISFLESTSSSPDRLALIVRRLTITVHVSEEFWRLRAQEERHAQNVDHARKSLIAWIKEVGEKLRKALQHMRGTTHLRFCYNADDSQFHPTWLMSLLNTCTFRLKTLVWEVEATDVELLIAKNLLQQDDLRTLKLKNVLQFDDDSQTNDLLRRFCPQLRTVSAPWPFVRAMLQHNRRILYVECSENFFGSSAFPTVVEQKHQHVKYLCWPSSFKNRSVSLPSFVNLILLEISFLNPEVRILIMLSPTTQLIHSVFRITSP